MGYCLSHFIDFQDSRLSAQACGFHAIQDHLSAERVISKGKKDMLRFCALLLAPGLGTITAQGQGGRVRTLPLSEKGQRAVNAYVEQARLTLA